MLSAQKAPSASQETTETVASATPAAASRPAWPEEADSVPYRPNNPSVESRMENNSKTKERGKE